MKEKGLHISINSPGILGFTGICFAALLLGYLTGGRSTMLVFSVYRSSLLNPLTYVRLIGHVFGHAGFDHLMGNIMLILIVGPLLEEKYGSPNIAFVILATALVTGIANCIFFPNTALLGASGVVFAFILLSSLTQMRDGSIPLTFILVVVLYIGQQVYQGLFLRDNVSNFTHILGGAVGSVLGWYMERHKMSRYRG